MFCYSRLGHREGAYHPYPIWARIYRTIKLSHVLCCNDYSLHHLDELWAWFCLRPCFWDSQ